MNHFCLTHFLMPWLFLLACFLFSQDERAIAQEQFPNESFSGPRLMEPVEFQPDQAEINNPGTNRSPGNLGKATAKPILITPRIKPNLTYPSSRSSQPVSISPPQYPASAPQQVHKPNSPASQPTESTSIVAPIVPGGSFYQPDYWIVSSRFAPQSGSQAGPGPLDYVHFDQSRIFHQKTGNDFENWFQPDTPVCIIVHGSFTTWNSLRYESGLLYQWLKRENNQPLQMVFFHWPSDGPNTLFIVNDIERLGSRACYNARYLKQVMRQVPESSPLYLFGHSHGARMIAQTIQELSYDPQWKNSPQPANTKLILAQAALDHHWLRPGQRNGQVLSHVNEVLNLKNSTDFALLVYPVQGSEGRESLGRVGFMQQDRYFLGPLMMKVKEFDLASWIGNGHLWSNLYKNRNIGRIVTNFIHQPKANMTPAPTQPPVTIESRKRPSNNAISPSDSPARAQYFYRARNYPLIRNRTPAYHRPAFNRKW